MDDDDTDDDAVSASAAASSIDMTSRVQCDAASARLSMMLVNG